MVLTGIVALLLFDRFTDGGGVMAGLVAGLLAALLKRLPKVGDEVKLEHLSMRVESMRGRRVDKVRLKLLASHSDSSASAAAGGAT